MRRLAAFAFTVAAICGTDAQAGLIASDSFATDASGNDYVPFTSILGQDPTVGCTGFVGPWGNCCTASMVVVTGGLTHPLTPGATYDGQLISYTSDGTVGPGNARNLSRAIDYTPSDGTYYMSVLLQKTASTTRGHLFAGLGRSQGAETSVFDIEGTWIGFEEGGISFVWGPDAHIVKLLSAAEMSVGETYFALMQYDFTTSGPDTVTATIFDGSSEQVASQEFTGLDLDETMGRFSVATADFGPIPVLDEWRFGSELCDVMVPEPIPGDANGDGYVNEIDAQTLANHWGQTGGWDEGDFSGNGTIGPEDASILAANWGYGTEQSGQSSAVPEPGILVTLLGMAALVLLWRRERKV